MSTERWERTKQILEEALRLASERRSAYLGLACGTDRELRSEVESLIASHEAAGSQFLGAPALEILELTSSRNSFETPGNEDRKFIGPYHLETKLGEGGMGQVWLAEQTTPVKRQVALKLIKGALLDSSALQRFQSERQSLAIMDHPAIAKVFDAGATPDGQPYFVMQYVPGVPITDYCDQKRLKIPERLELFIKVCEGVQHAHQKAVIHRDLKPANILVVEVDGKPLPRIIDFGLAKATTDDALGQAQLTRAGSFLGTPGYMSPEQADPGLQDVDTRTDIYSLGAVLYVLLTGSLPFKTERGRKQPLDEELRQLREDDPPRPSTKAGMQTESCQATAEARGTEPKQLASLLRGDLDWITVKALDKDRACRYSTPSELSADIHRYLRHEPVQARPASAGYRVAKFVHRNRTAVALASLTFAALVAGVTATVRQGHNASVQRDFAFRELARAERINSLNQFLLSDAAASSRPLTANNLLDRAVHIIERENYANDPGNHIKILVSLGLQFYGREENERAEQLFEQAYQLSRRIQEASARAQASCALAATVARSGKYDRADALIRDGLHEIPDDVQFAPDRVFCLLRGSDVSTTEGAAQQALLQAQLAKRILENSRLSSGSLRLSAAEDLAAAYSFAGRHREAIAEFSLVSAQMSDLGYDDTRSAATLYQAWGLALSLAGQSAEAEKTYRRAIDIRSAYGDDASSPALLNSYADALRLKSPEEAAKYAEEAYNKAQQFHDAVIMKQSLMERSKIYREEHDFARSAAMLNQVEPLLRRDLPPGHYAFARLAQERALLAEAEGDSAKALQLVNEAVAMCEQAIRSGGQGAFMVPNVLTQRSRLELAAHQADKAEVDAARALSLAQAAVGPGTYSTNIGYADLALGRALQAQGRTDEARAAFRAAAENFEKTVGPDYPDARTVRQLAGEKVE